LLKKSDTFQQRKGDSLQRLLRVKLFYTLLFQSKLIGFHSWPNILPTSDPEIKICDYLRLNYVVKFDNNNNNLIASKDELDGEIIASVLGSTKLLFFF